MHAYIPATDLPSKTTRARYVLRSADGSAQVVTVNQAVSNVWVDLGTYTQGPTCASSYVYLQNDTDDPASSTNVVWDLMRFTPDPYYVPLVARATSMSPLGGTWGSGLRV